MPRAVQTVANVATARFVDRGNCLFGYATFGDHSWSPFVMLDLLCRTQLAKQQSKNQRSALLK